MKRLLIIEDEDGIRESLADYFGLHEYLVSAVSSAEEGAEVLARGDVALVLLDLLLPGVDGLEQLRRMRQAGDRTPVIILTALGAEERRVEGLRLGADDYVVKPFGLAELHARVEAVLRRAAPAGRALRIGAARVNLAAHEIVRGERRERLLHKEAELLAFLLQNPGRTFERTELLREVWGYDATPTTRTVDTHIFQLRRKLEEHPERPRHLLTVHGVGYRLDP